MALLVQFLLRLVFGLATGMLLVSPRQVTSGYFRNNLYVTLGLSALAALLGRAAAPTTLTAAIVAGAASYLGAVAWLYEKPRAGRAALLIVALAALLGSTQATRSIAQSSSSTAALASRYFSEPDAGAVLTAADAERLAAAAQQAATTAERLGLAANLTSSWLLGAVTAAMLLGHWYLNSPTMHLAPLRRLVVALGVAAALRALVAALGLAGEVFYAAELAPQWWLFILLRWSFGLAAVAVLTWMAWQTLKIPNTQSATGILYVAVIGAFVGETMALLLSAESLFPL